MNIRPSCPTELGAIRQIHQQAFGRDQGPAVSSLVAELFSDPSAQPLLSLVAEQHARLIGSILYSPVRIEGDRTPVQARILAPLAVMPGDQKSGIGSALIQAGLNRLSADGVDLVLVYGDPGYYARTGFEPALPHCLHPPHAIEYPEGWMVRALKQGVLNRASGVVRCCDALNAPEHW